MKRLIAILTMVAGFALDAFAMEPISEQELSCVTGMAGVSIFVDVTMNISIDTIAWGDSDGLVPGPYNPWGIDTAGGYVGVTNFRITNLSIMPWTYGYQVMSSNFYWPGQASIDVYNGTAYYRVHVGAPDIQ